MKFNNIESLYYNNSSFRTNIHFTQEIIKTLLSEDNLKKFLTNENVFNLQKFVPESMKSLLYSPKVLSNFLLNTKTKFFTPSEIFLKMYSHNFFTQIYQENIKNFNQENLNDYIDKYILTLQKLKSLASNTNNSTISTNLDNLITFDFHLDDASSGYASIDTNKDNLTTSDNFLNDETHNKDIDANDFPSSINITNKKKKNSKITDSIMNNFSDDNDTMINDNVLTSDRFKNLKKNKIQITIKPRTQEEIQFFRKQELERYKHPNLPWEYTLLNGKKAVVAPLIKKNKANNSKARDHALLKQDRPPYITILSLVRDAAAKLEDGVGTRADICELLKDSQYITENLTDSQINSIVSGALDRLHYEKDPCVKYDLHRKLWIYLHKNRKLDDKNWRDGDDKNNINNLSEFKGDNEENRNVEIVVNENVNVSQDGQNIIIKKEKIRPILEKVISKEEIINLEDDNENGISLLGKKSIHEDDINGDDSFKKRKIK